MAVQIHLHTSMLQDVFVGGVYRIPTYLRMTRLLQQLAQRSSMSLRDRLGHQGYRMSGPQRAQC